jgi:hypothetical protein
VNYRHEFVFCVMAGLLFFQNTPGGANFAPVTVTPEGVSAMHHESIRMDVQDVTIRLRKSDYVVEAVFQLFNTGETITQWVGLHKYCEDCSFMTPFYDFKVEVDGRPATFSTRNELWMLGQVTFPGGASTTIRIRYAARFNPRGPGRNEGFYNLANSGYWKDKIKKVAVTLDSSEICETKRTEVLFGLSSGARALTKRVGRHELKDFKPTPRSRIDFP